MVFFEDMLYKMLGFSLQHGLGFMSMRRVKEVPKDPLLNPYQKYILD